MFCLLLCGQIEKDEVTLRRVIGSKKDQYFLDKKMTTCVLSFCYLFLVFTVNISVMSCAMSGNKIFYAVADQNRLEFCLASHQLVSDFLSHVGSSIKEYMLNPTARWIS